MPLSQAHVTAGVAGVSTTTMLATVLQAWQGVNADVAGAEAGLIVLGLGALYSIGSSYLMRLPPSAPVTSSAP